jgi:ribosomal protein S18 acetylase RimI-like enzyme
MLESLRGTIDLRRFEPHDWPAVWAVLEPIFRLGDVYAYPAGISEAEVRSLWVERPLESWVARDEAGQIVGAYYIRPNQLGGGSHVCNCGYAVADSARGRGIAARMCEHSQQAATRLGFRSMQFNFVISSNQSAVHLWKKLGFEIVGMLPEAFRHPSLGYVDALVMFKRLGA